MPATRRAQIMEEHVKSLERKLEEQAKTMQELMQMVREMKESSNSSDASPRTPVNTNFKQQGMNPKLEFPKFDGSNPRNWLKKCCRYFALCRVPDEQKVNPASLYMVDRAESWVTSYLTVRANVEWDDFIIDLVARFKDTKSLNVVEQFNKLNQSGTLEDYIDEFESLKAIMMQSGHILPDSYLLESFVGGLKDSSKPFVRAFKPNNIAEAIEHARLSEEQFALLNHKPYYKPITAKPLQAVPFT